MLRLTKEERVLRTINRKEIDYLPSQLVITDRARYYETLEALGLSSEKELNDYLECHLKGTWLLQDKVILFKDVKEEMDKLHEILYYIV